MPEPQVPSLATYAELDDLRGTGAVQAQSVRGGVTVTLYTDGRFRNEKGVIVPLDASGPWRITKLSQTGGGI